MGGTGHVDAKGRYHCDSCGHTWRPFFRWLWWPVSLVWGSAMSSTWLRRHGVEVPVPGALMEQRHAYQVWHVGRLKVLLGKPRTR